VSVELCRAQYSETTLNFVAIGDTFTGDRRKLWGDYRTRRLSKDKNDFEMNFRGLDHAYNPDKNKLTRDDNYITDNWSAFTEYAHHADFVLALGDKFYDNSISSLHMPCYTIFGDCGYESDASKLSAQIELGDSKDDNRWHGGYCYRQSFIVPESTASLDVVFIDTFLTATEATYVKSTSAGVSQETTSQKAEEQANCLESYLASSRASFLVVAGHYPIFSSG